MATQQTPFEALGDRRFQAFAQSLLSYEFPEIQAFPVGQRDGGRDATWSPRKSKDSIIFQVKFVEQPKKPADVENWLKEIIDKEKASITRLIASGATKYYLITNVRGTAYPGSGAIDTGANYLEKAVSIESQILWRDDIEIRLAKHRVLKWHYRELLSGQDVIDELVLSGVSENAVRRRTALRASISVQFSADRLVRFKQADLQHELLDLFIDVPVARGRSFSQFKTEIRRGSRLTRDEMVIFDGPGKGAADFLLKHGATRKPQRMVIEGAPGQGKSTLAQYLCQVHRIKLLDKGSDLAKLPSAHQAAATRLPFKIDLRELASFLRKEDPFEEVIGWGGLPLGWARSLVGFLAAQVNRYSGNSDFTVSDLQATVQEAPMLLMLDGFDEVAELVDRRAIVDVVEEGLDGLEAIAEDIQVVVTSRPPAFVSSPGFPRSKYAYFSLGSLTPDLVIRYAELWTNARKLSDDEARELQAILSQKLGEDHMRDLTRNPMQLAILLSLISIKGDSLPDKRTQLYVGYMELYFDREASKSKVVRNNRELLYGFHGYLAWLLHAGAERSAAKGSITQDDLRREVTKYLENQGVDAGLADDLFRGVVERIIALVATRQQRFEFEVQPLREFFAAHHLFSTAQVSQFGISRSGTRADRFDALARNAFWLNVARFYGGFYTSGELPSLADQLEALAEDNLYSQTGRPRAVAAMLLADWSFSLERRSRERAIKVVLAGIGKRHAMTASGEWLRLPKGSGQREAAGACLKLLGRKTLSIDRRQGLDLALARHWDNDELMPKWLELVSASRGKERTNWIATAAIGDWIENIPNGEIRELIVGDNPSHDVIEARVVNVFGAGAVDAIEEDKALSAVAIAWILKNPFAGWIRPRGKASYLQSLGYLVAYGAMAHAQPVDMTELRLDSLSPCPEHLEACDRIVQIAMTHVDEETSQVGWSEIINALTREYKEQFAGLAIAMRQAHAGRAVKRRGLDLTDHSVPLFDRVNEAQLRKRSTDESWWRSQLESVVTPTDRQFVAVSVLLWSTGRVFANAAVAVGAMLDELSDIEYIGLVRMVEFGPWWRTVRASPMSQRQIRQIPMRLVTLLYVASTRDQSKMWRERLAKYTGSEAMILRYACDAAIVNAKSEGDWKRVTRLARRIPTWEPELMDGELARAGRMPLSFASTIVRSADRYPLWMVELAEEMVGASEAQPVPLGAIAKQKQWF
jgi:hypothetical protein